jgi:hypothetical protein
VFSIDDKQRIPPPPDKHLIVQARMRTPEFKITIECSACGAMQSDKAALRNLVRLISKPSCVVRAVRVAQIDSFIDNGVENQLQRTEA